MDYLARTLLAPIIDRRISSLEVKATAENQWVNAVQHDLKGSVFEAGCSNWYMNQNGRNSASWPGYASSYWAETLRPHPGVFKQTSGSRVWFVNTLLRWIRTTRKRTYGVLFIALAGILWHRDGGIVRGLSEIYQGLVCLKR